MMTRPQLAAPPLATALLLAGLSIEGCRPAPETAAVNEAVIAITADLGGINPLTAGGDQTTREILDQLFLRLFEEQADYADHPPSLEGRLVDSFEWSDAGTTLTLELRPDAVWSDGEPVTAEDVAWTLAARVDPGVAWADAGSQDQIEDWEVLGGRKIAVRFARAYPDRLTDLNESPILPRHVWSEIPFDQWRRNDEWFRRHLVVSGPFDLAEWRPTERVILARNPRYFRLERPSLDRVVLVVVPKKPNQLEQLLAGDVDFVAGLRPSSAARVESSERAEIDSFWHRQYAYIMWNACRPPLDDSVIRRALTLAIDRSSILEAVYGEYGRLAVTPILSSIWASDSDLEPWPFDPAEAARLLDSRGWRDSDGDGVRDRDGEPLALRLVTNAENRMRIDIITLAQDYLLDVGVGVELETLEWSTFMARNKGRDFDATMGTWLIDTSLDLRSEFHSASIDKRNNWMCYRNPEVDRLIERADRQLDAAAKLEPLQELQRILHQDQPYTFLFELKRINGVSRRLRDARSNPLRNFADLEDWWIDSAI